MNKRHYFKTYRISVVRAHVCATLKVWGIYCWICGFLHALDFGYMRDIEPLLRLTKAKKYVHGKCNT